ncbi:MAG: Holliday junction resolvase RuvX [Planctomycetes bacterium]|nr:Holliday junction resolvase RuvX [Planctomycetota bacterium]
MRILGIDYGRKRIGLAVSDPLCITAQPLPTLHRGDAESDMAALEGLIREREVDEVVVGLPKNMDGSLGAIAQEALTFADELRARFQLAVHMVDERLSTSRAHKAMKSTGLSRKKRAGSADKVAAQLILQSYLDQKGQRG